MPKGSLLNQNLPSGVRRIVRSLEGGDRGACQNPLFVSNSLGFSSLARVKSTVGRGVDLMRHTFVEKFQVHTNPYVTSP